jgi:hypothetical protein
MIDWRDRLAVYPAWNAGTDYETGTITNDDIAKGRVTFLGPAEKQPYSAKYGGGPYNGGAPQLEIPNPVDVVKNLTTQKMPNP